MIVKVKIDGESVFEVKAKGNIEFSYGHVLFDDGVTYYDAPMEDIVSITEE